MRWTVPGQANGPEAIKPPGDGMIMLLASAIKAGNAKRVWRPRDFAEAGLPHAISHFVRRRKTLDGFWQVRIGTTNSRNDCADSRKHMFEVEAINLPRQSCGFPKIQNAAFTPGLQQTSNFSQSSVVISQIAETECRRDQIKVSISERKKKRIGFDPKQGCSARLLPCALQHGVRKICAQNVSIRKTAFAK